MKAVACSVLAWLLTLFAGFWALGNPPAGPNFEHAMAMKLYVSRGSLLLALALVVASVAMSIRAWKSQQFASSWLAVGLDALWAALVLYGLLLTNS
jgi:hypothetical protein